MSTRRPILFPAICLALAVFCAATAQPLQPEGDNEFGGTPGMHLFLQSRFIRTHQADRLHFAFRQPGNLAGNFCRRYP